MTIKGNVFLFGDNVNTDEIIPARYLSTHDPAELAKYCMEDIRPGFGRRADLQGSVLTAGENFGCGSSREHAPIAVKAAGIACVIARSFARIFLRNGINIGLPLVELPRSAHIPEGHVVEVDVQNGRLTDTASRKVWTTYKLQGPNLSKTTGPLKRRKRTKTKSSDLWRRPFDLTPELAQRLLHGLAENHRDRLESHRRSLTGLFSTILSMTVVTGLGSERNDFFR